MGTAKEGARLRVLGETSRPVTIRFPGIDKAFRVRPVVIEGLAMDVNLAGPFLQAHGIDHLHSVGALQVGSRSVPLVARSEEPAVQEVQGCVGSPEVGVYVQGAQEVPARSVGVVKLRLGRPAAHTPELSSRDDWLVEGTASFMNKTDLHPCLAALVHPAPDGSFSVQVMNTQPHSIPISNGVRFGNAQVVDSSTSPVVQSLDPQAELKAPPPLAEDADLATKAAWLRAAFRLDDSPWLQTIPAMAQALALLLRFWPVFSLDGSFGKTDLIQHEIVTVPHPPIKERFRPISPALLEDLKRQLREWAEHDVIEPSKSPWNFALVAATKKNSSKKRWCVDYRPLNAITIKDSFPLPQIEDNLVRLGRSRIFSGIDGCGAYHVVEVAQKDREKTAFSTPLGSFQFKRMPFGLTNAPATYCRLVQMVLEGIPYDMAIPYLDDTCVHSSDLPGHFRALGKVLQAHVTAGLKLQPSKCNLFRDQIEYLGHVVSAKGVHPPRQYVQVIQDWPLPTTKTQARAFLGKVGYYRRFIKGYAALARPWTEVTGVGSTPEEEKAPLAVSPAMKASFADLKGRLLSAPVLAYARFDLPEPFILDTDWSHDSATLGAVLSQKQDGLERVICYGAKGMQPSERNYPPCKAELLALIHFCKSWRYYLLHRKFIWRTDHAGLQYLKTMDPPEGMVGRWLQLLANYDFDIVYRPGPKHGNADALSRISHAPEVAEALDEGSLCSIQAAWALDPADLLAAQKADPDLARVRQWLADGKPAKVEVTAGSEALKVYAQIFDQLHLDHRGLLCRTRDDRPLVCVPSSLVPRVIKHAHHVGGHQATEATARRLQQVCYFPLFLRTIREWLAACAACAARGSPPKAQRGELVTFQSGYPFQKLSVDFVGPLPTSSRGHRFLFTVKDTFSRWFEAFPVRRASAEAACRCLEDHIFARFGIPEVIHADRGSTFTGHKFRTMCHELQVQLTFTPAYHPQSNPVERSHRDLKAILSALTAREDQCAWEDHLPHALFAMRTAISSATGTSPFHLLFGRDPATPLSILFGSPDGTQGTASGSEAAYAVRLRQRMEAAHEYARTHMSAEVRRRRRRYGQSTRHFAVGSLVWLFTSRVQPGAARKLARYWSGPWRVRSQENQLLYRIAPDPRWPWPRADQVVSVDRLKVFLADPAQSFPPERMADLTEGADELALSPDTDARYGPAARPPDHDGTPETPASGGHERPPPEDPADSDSESDPDEPPDAAAHPPPAPANLPPPPVDPGAGTPPPGPADLPPLDPEGGPLADPVDVPEDAADGHDPPAPAPASDGSAPMSEGASEGDDGSSTDDDDDLPAAADVDLFPMAEPEPFLGGTPPGSPPVQLLPMDLRHWDVSAHSARSRASSPSSSDDMADPTYRPSPEPSHSPAAPYDKGRGRPAREVSPHPDPSQPRTHRSGFSLRTADRPVEGGDRPPGGEDEDEIFDLFQEPERQEEERDQDRNQDTNINLGNPFEAYNPFKGKGLQRSPAKGSARGATPAETVRQPTPGTSTQGGAWGGAPAGVARSPTLETGDQNPFKGKGLQRSPQTRTSEGTRNAPQASKAQGAVRARMQQYDRRRAEHSRAKNPGSKQKR